MNGIIIGIYSQWVRAVAAHSKTVKTLDDLAFRISNLRNGRFDAFKQENILIKQKLDLKVSDEPISATIPYETVKYDFNFRFHTAFNLRETLAAYGDYWILEGSEVSRNELEDANPHHLLGMFRINNKTFSQLPITAPEFQL